ncbi:hypothetical protein NC796_24825 [Aliifodinibius sp. S!AR15-10]|uniref:hypothetical protein n=1 Tax=Aliifodinibius sp. S!AR15-10 TaxID=2950437 RepID=UPI00285E3990|nr:hypothetical protein [Aliifodinibius sp. S!AR15-10]MDR8394396.1 hypothetical protein [Aliifodinibius sp. S!AR15-10]
MDEIEKVSKEKQTAFNNHYRHIHRTFDKYYEGNSSNRNQLSHISYNISMKDRVGFR